MGKGQQTISECQKTKFMIFHTPQKWVTALSLNIGGVNMDRVKDFIFLGLTIMNIFAGNHIQR